MVSCESATVAGSTNLLLDSVLLLVLNSAVVFDVLIAVFVVAIVNNGFAVSEVASI